MFCRLQCGVSTRVSHLRWRAGYHHRHPRKGLLPSATPTQLLGSGFKFQPWLVSTAPCLPRPRMDAPLCPRGPARPQGERHPHPAASAQLREDAARPLEAGTLCLSLFSPVIWLRHGDKTTLELPEAFSPTGGTQNATRRVNHLNCQREEERQARGTPVRGSLGDPGSRPCFSLAGEGPRPGDPPSWRRTGASFPSVNVDNAPTSRGVGRGRGGDGGLAHSLIHSSPSVKRGSHRTGDGRHCGGLS